MTIDPNKWQDEGVIYRPATPLEDFVVLPSHKLKVLEAVFVAGPDFQHLRLHRMNAASPRGPFKNPHQITDRRDAHTRLYSTQPWEGNLFVTAAWPRAGSLGIWHFWKNSDWGSGVWEKRLIIPPEGPYSAVAGNPTSYYELVDDETRWHVVFEGRSETSGWQLFHAVFGSLFDNPRVAHLGPGANPRLARHGEEVFLYYSDTNFDVALKTQHA